MRERRRRKGRRESVAVFADHPLDPRWVALDEATMKNGALHFIPGSWKEAELAAGGDTVICTEIDSNGSKITV